jgi:hypothetical protein
MLIPNPIYDTVFKYLMENSDIARGIISEIIGEEIEHLELKAKENILNPEKGIPQFCYFDYIAKIKQEDGGYKTVSIGLHKSDTPTDIIRFMRCFREQYKKEEEITGKDDSIIKEPLPVISIYILGYCLSRTLPGVIKANRPYFDVLGGKEIEERNEFIECLPHDSYVIQDTASQLEMKSRLEYILAIFKQEKFIGDDHRLKSYEYEVDDELLKKILKQLEKAAASKELLHQLELEEMALREYEAYEGAIGRLEKNLEQKDKTIEENKKTIEEKDKTIEENKKMIEEKEKYIAELLTKLGKK